MEEITLKSQRKKILAYERGFMAIHLMNIGSKLGIFEVLMETPEGFEVTELALKLKLHEPYLKIWCQSAYHYEILDWENNRFKLPPFFDEILGDKSNINNYAANTELDVDLAGQLLSKAPEYYRSGELVLPEYTPEISKVVYEATKNVPLAFQYIVLPQNIDLNTMFNDGLKLLDIGCGNGSFIINLAQNFKNCFFIGIGSDNFGIEQAENRISQLGLVDQVTVINRNGEDLQYNEEFDVVTTVFVLHEILPSVRQEVLNKAYQSLKKGGQLLILDFPYPKDIQDFRNYQYAGGIYDQCFEATIGSVHLTSVEVNDLLCKTGFTQINRTIVVKSMIDLVRAIK